MIEYFVFMFGILATGVSTYLGYKFYQIDHPLARNIAWMALGGAVTGLGTLIFSIYALLPIHYAPDMVMNFLRVMIFTGITLADYLMLRRFQQIGRDK